MTDSSKLFLVTPIRRRWRDVRTQWRAWGLPQLPDLLLVWIGGTVTWAIGGVLGAQELLLTAAILWSLVALGLVGRGAMRSPSMTRRCWGTGLVGLAICAVGLLAVVSLPVPIPLPRHGLALWCGTATLMLIGGLLGDLVGRRLARRRAQ